MMMMLVKVKVRVFRQKLTLEDAIGSHACLLETNMRVTNDSPLGSPLLTVVIMNYVETLKVLTKPMADCVGLPPLVR
jgi:hypothetical protein